jgi:hypothetical protein
MSMTPPRPGLRTGTGAGGRAGQLRSARNWSSSSVNVAGASWWEFERFFSGLELAEPGVVPLPEWRGVGSGYPIPCYAGMGRKPFSA